MSMVGVAVSCGMVRVPDLRAEFGRGAVTRALASGELERLGRSVVGLAGDRRNAALRHGGVVAGLSAAREHGWQVLEDERRAVVVVPRGRHLDVRARRSVEIWRGDLAVDDKEGFRTSAIRTVEDCARRLSWPAALTVADSALRAGDVSLLELEMTLGRARGPGSRQAQLVAQLACGRAANAFESATRAVLHTTGYDFIPQHEVRLSCGTTIHPDLVCAELSLGFECNSFEFHTTARQIRQDCWRALSMTRDGWKVLPVSWDMAMFEWDWLAETVGAIADARAGELGVPVRTRRPVPWGTPPRRTARSA